MHIDTTSRGGAKLSPLHLGMLILSILLLTISAIFLIAQWNLLGIIAMILGIAVRVIDTKL